MTGKHLGLIVTDASPLITLAAGDALSCLTMPGLPVYIPDMVYLEVTRDMARLGAEEVVDWVRSNQDRVMIVPTKVFSEYQSLLNINHNTKSKGRGEQAALEVLEFETSNDPDLQAILIFEDTDIRSRNFVRVLPENVSALSTGDLLRELEGLGRIQSSDQILDQAAERGRNVERQRQGAADIQGRDLLRTSIHSRDEEKDRDR